MNRDEWKAWYAGQSLRYRVHYKIITRLNRFEDWLCEQPDWLSGHDWLYPAGFSPSLLMDLLCWLLGHEPIVDQCLIPAHDYCAWCGLTMPGQARERMTNGT